MTDAASRAEPARPRSQLGRAGFLYAGAASARFSPVWTGSESAADLPGITPHLRPSCAYRRKGGLLSAGYHALLFSASSDGAHYSTISTASCPPALHFRPQPPQTTAAKAAQARGFSPPLSTGLPTRCLHASRRCISLPSPLSTLSTAVVVGVVSTYLYVQQLLQPWISLAEVLRALHTETAKLPSSRWRYHSGQRRIP